MSKTEDHILETEQKWLSVLFTYCRNLFKKVHLPSHDHYHHLRVWYFAKELINELSENNYIPSCQFLEGLIISIFFHDSGMTLSGDERHGWESARICRNFFDEKKIILPENFSEICQAIENHDNKDYAAVHSLKPDLHLIPINTLLHICDDLDAFGYTGIYRYAEIYMLRDVSPDQLAGKVIINLEKRFENIISLLGHLTAFIHSHRKRYEITRKFFRNLAVQKKINSTRQLCGAAEVMRVIRDQMIFKMKITADIIREIDQLTKDQYTINFFKRLWEEEKWYRNFFPDL